MPMHNPMSGVFRWSAASPFAPLVIVYAAACLVFGGGTRAGFAGDVVLQLAGLPLALWAIWRLLDVERGEGRGRGRGVLAIAVCGAVLGLHALQLIPLPPWLWSLLPERRAMLDALEIVGIEPGWLPISVSPRATWLSAIAFIPSVAVLLGVMQLDLKDRRVLSLAILLVGLASVFLGLLQLAQGPSSPLRFFEITNATEAVGFFANRNHFSALLYCLLLIAAPWMLLVAAQIAAVGGRLQSREALPQLLGLIGTFTVFMMLIGAQTMARSRAGLGLTIAALGGVLMMAYLGPRPRTVESPARSSRRRSISRLDSWGVTLDTRRPIPGSRLRAASSSETRNTTGPVPSRDRSGRRSSPFSEIAIRCATLLPRVTRTGYGNSSGVQYVLNEASVQLR